MDSRFIPTTSQCTTLDLNIAHFLYVIPLLVRETLFLSENTRTDCLNSFSSQGFAYVGNISKIINLTFLYVCFYGAKRY